VTGTVRVAVARVWRLPTELLPSSGAAVAAGTATSSSEPEVEEVIFIVSTADTAAGVVGGGGEVFTVSSVPSSASFSVTETTTASRDESAAVAPASSVETVVGPTFKHSWTGSLSSWSLSSWSNFQIRSLACCLHRGCRHRAQAGPEEEGQEERRRLWRRPRSSGWRWARDHRFDPCSATSPQKQTGLGGGGGGALGCASSSESPACATLGWQLFEAALPVLPTTKELKKFPTRGGFSASFSLAGAKLGRRFLAHSLATCLSMASASMGNATPH